MADTLRRRRLWADHFDAQGVQYAFYSAAYAAALQQARREQLERVEAQEKVASSSDHQSGSISNQDGVVTESEGEDDDREVEGVWEDESDEEDLAEYDPLTFEEESEYSHDPRIRVLSVLELEELFLKVAPDLSSKSCTQSVFLYRDSAL